MKRPLTLKVFLVLAVSMVWLMVFSSMLTPTPSQSRIMTFWANLTLLLIGIAYMIVFFGLWRANRVAYAAILMIEALPWILGMQYYAWPVFIPQEFSIPETIAEVLLLLLSWRFFFRNEGRK